MMTVEALAGRRRRLLVTNAVGFVVWQLGSLAGPWVGKSMEPLAIVVGLAGAAAWMTALVLLLRGTPDARAAEILQDELTRHNQLRATQWGYWLMLITAAGGMTLATIVPVPAADTLRVLVIVGVAAPIVRFVWLERPDVA